MSDDFEGNLHMIRILSCLAITIAIAFWMMALGATPGVERFDTLQLVASSSLVIGVGLTLVGFVAMTYAGDVRNKKLAEHSVVFGLLVAAFGLGIFPLFPEKVFAVPACALLSFAMARISFKSFRATNEFGSAVVWPIMLMAGTGFASIWALASGWTWVQAGSLFLIGIAASCVSAFARPAHREPMSATS